MKLHLRLTILALLLSLGAVLASLLVNQVEHAERAAIIKSTNIALATNVGHWVKLSQSGMQKFVEDYSWWDDMVAFVADSDPAWAELNFEDSLEFWEISGLWVFDPTGKIVYRLAVDPLNGIEFPLTQSQLWETCQQEPFPHFFKSTPAGLLELRGAPIQPSDDDDRISIPKGWFFVGRLWDTDYLSNLSPDEHTHLSIEPPSARSAAADHLSGLQVLLPLWDEHNLTIAHLGAQRDAGEIELWQEAGIDETLMMLISAAIAVSVLVVWLGIWIVRPIRVIDEALRTQTKDPIIRLSGARNEFGEIARLIIASFDQSSRLLDETNQRRETERDLRETEEKLRQALHDRSQLGLDLHDSTIQTLYASGMSLVSLESQNPNLPPAVSGSLREVRKNLQLTIDELRAFIGHIESRKPPDSLAGSIDNMLSFLRNSSPGLIEPEIDEIPDDRLTPEQSLNLLQILRESVTNALRHAKATRIVVRLMVREKLVHLRVEDDGIGLPPGMPQASSRGLSNIQERAHSVAAEIKIESPEGGGTRIDLIFRDS